jgi:hypothetical protein
MEAPIASGWHAPTGKCVLGRYDCGEGVTTDPQGHRWPVDYDTVKLAPWWAKLMVLWGERRAR